MSASQGSGGGQRSTSQTELEWRNSHAGWAVFCTKQQEIVFALKAKCEAIYQKVPKGQQLVFKASNPDHEAVAFHISTNFVEFQHLVSFTGSNPKYGVKKVPSELRSEIPTRKPTLTIFNVLWRKDFVTRAYKHVLDMKKEESAKAQKSAGTASRQGTPGNPSSSQSKQ